MSYSAQPPNTGNRCTHFISPSCRTRRLLNPSDLSPIPWGARPHPPRGDLDLSRSDDLRLDDIREAAGQLAEIVTSRPAHVSVDSSSNFQ